MSVAAVALTTTIFWDFLTAALASNLDADVSVLRLADCSGGPAQAIRFALAFSQLLLVLTVAWLLVFGALKPPALDPTSRFMKWVSAMAILVGLGTMSMPWRLLWNNKSPPIEVGQVKGYVVARDDDELFVYAPKEPAGKQHLTIRPDDPRITSLSRTPEYIFGEESCEEGVVE